VLVTVVLLGGAGLAIWGRGYLGGLSPADALWLVVIVGPVVVGLELIGIDLSAPQRVPLLQLALASVAGGVAIGVFLTVIFDDVALTEGVRFGLWGLAPLVFGLALLRRLPR
jgi:hypothetical protein